MKPALREAPAPTAAALQVGTGIRSAETRRRERPSAWQHERALRPQEITVSPKTSPAQALPQHLTATDPYSLCSSSLPLNPPFNGSDSAQVLRRTLQGEIQPRCLPAPLPRLPRTRTRLPFSIAEFLGFKIHLERRRRAQEHCGPPGDWRPPLWEGL